MKHSALISFYCALTDNEKIVALLIKNGANLESVDEDGESVFAESVSFSKFS